MIRQSHVAPKYMAHVVRRGFGFLCFRRSFVVDIHYPPSVLTAEKLGVKHISVLLEFSSCEETAESLDSFVSSKSRRRQKYARPPKSVPVRVVSKLQRMLACRNGSGHGPRKSVLQTSRMSVSIQYLRDRIPQVPSSNRERKSSSCSVTQGSSQADAQTP